MPKPVTSRNRISSKPSDVLLDKVWEHCGYDIHHYITANHKPKFVIIKDGEVIRSPSGRIMTFEHCTDASNFVAKLNRKKND